MLRRQAEVINEQIRTLAKLDAPLYERMKALNIVAREADFYRDELHNEFMATVHKKMEEK